MIYINVDEFIKKHEDRQMSGFDLLEALKETPAADVVPMKFIDKWFNDHYGTHVNPIRDAWEKENER